uniref:hypothetical protein n=1 Tax=uncultured Maritalea sp. TaxID=757249 RepID=UPI0026263476
MTNSNDRNNLATDQTDDLIAELARIVADDAKQASVSKSVDERAQLAADAREKKDAQRSFEQQIEADQSSQDIAQPQTEQGAGEILPFSKSGDTAPFSQIGEGVTAIRTPSPTEPSDEMQEPANTTGSAFEFDFSHNIKMGVDNAADSRSETEDLDFAPSQMDEMAEAASFDVDETIPTPDVLDGIAAIIEDVEHQSAEPVAPEFDPIPVPSGPTSQPNDDQPEKGIESELSDNLERRSAASGGDFEYIPQQNLQVPVGEDEFAVPPSQTSDGADLSEEVEDPLTEIENLIADTNSPPTTNPQPADAAEAAILAALASAAGTRPSVEKSPVAAARASTAQLREPRLEPEAPTARDFVDPVAHQSVQPERKANYDDEPRRGGSILPIVASVAAIVLLAVVGGVAYWFFVGQNPA